MKNARITIYQSGKHGFLLRKVAVFLDNEYCCAISQNRPHPVSVSLGRHILRAKVDWLGPPEFSFEIKDNEQKDLELSCNYKAKGKLVSAVALIVFLLGIIYKENLQSELLFDFWISILILLVFLQIYLNRGKAMLYYLTIGRKKYFKFEEGKAVERKLNEIISQPKLPD